MVEATAHKVKPHHLEREACPYVRQSPLKQVRFHTESARRQYGMQHADVALGSSEDRIRVIDGDQGLSGASADRRSGFRDLPVRIAADEVSIVLCLEISRLARNRHDLSRQLQLARFSDTLILDEAGVHDPSDSSDKLLLDIKVTVSEVELAGIRVRLMGGQSTKAVRGELRLPLPVGLAYEDQGRVGFDPERQLVEAMHLVFSALRDKMSNHAAERAWRDLSQAVAMWASSGQFQPSRGKENRG